MNFTAYVQRQKKLILGRSRCETFFAEKREEFSKYDREELLHQLDNLKGLNTFERLSCKNCGGLSA